MSSLNAKLGATRLADYAEALIAEGRLADAETILDRIDVAQTPEARPYLLQSRAELAFARGEWPAAIKALGELTSLEPLNGRALLRLGQSHKHAGDLPRADFTFEMLARVPNYAYEANIELADSALKSRHHDRALDHLRAALAVRRTTALQEYIARLELLVGTQAAPEDRSR